jgi:hypothetical protein
VALVEGGCDVEFALGRAGEVALRLGAQGRLVLLDPKQAIGAGVDDLLSDRRIAGDGVDGDQSAVEVEQFHQLRDGDDLVGLLVDGLLALEPAWRWWGVIAEAGAEAGRGFDRVAQRPASAFHEDAKAMTEEQKIIRAKAGLLELAKQLCNVS